MSVRSDSEIASEAPTAEDQSLQGGSIKSDDGVVTADDMSRRTSDSIHTEPDVKGHGDDGKTGSGRDGTACLLSRIGS